MTSDELLDLFRRDVVDTRRPYLWSDDEIWAYMSDAHRMFARLTGGIPDYTTDEACLVDAVAGEKFARLHPSVLTVRRAHLEGPGREVRVINAQDTDSLSDEDYGVLRRLSLESAPGEVRYMVVGMEADTVQWISTPAVDQQVRLLVERLPLGDITGPAQAFEGVKAHHHLHFLKWMRHHAYGKQDAETFDPKRSDAEARAFTAYCALARAEKDRSRHKVRVVRYGGL